MKRYQNRHEAVLSTRGFYTILTVCALVIAASAWVLWSSMHQTPTVDPVPTAPMLAPVQTSPVQQTPADAPVETEDTAEVDAPDEPPAVEAAAPAAPAMPDESQTVYAPVYVRPVSGAVITPFSGDELLFQPTFGDWRVHTGTDFAAEAGEAVLSVTAGTVQQVFEDGLFGTCVTVAHDADLTTTYRGLDEVYPTVGQHLAAGEAIGTVAETADAEAALGTHLHLEAARAGTAVDVLELLGEYETE